MTERSLLERVQYLEDVEAIKKLTATYAHGVDRGVNGKHVNGALLPSLFAEDATWRNASQGVDLAGRDEIVAYLVTEGPISFAQHSFTNPVIEVDGDSASAEWLLWVSVNIGGSLAEVYQSENLTYERAGDGWVIKRIDLHFGQMITGGTPPA